MSSLEKYAASFYHEVNEISQGCIIFFTDAFQVELPCCILQKSVPRSDPPKIIDPVGIVIIENECDLIEETRDSLKARRTVGSLIQLNQPSQIMMWHGAASDRDSVTIKPFPPSFTSAIKSSIVEISAVHASTVMSRAIVGSPSVIISR